MSSRSTRAAELIRSRCEAGVMIFIFARFIISLGNQFCSKNSLPANLMGVAYPSTRWIILVYKRSSSYKLYYKLLIDDNLRK